MGGAAASICALMLAKNGFTIDSIHSFGTPRFTDGAGAAEFDRLFGGNFLRVVFYDDPIRNMPSSGGRANYTHCGRVAVLHEDGTFWSLADSPAAEPVRTMNSSKGLTLHRTSYYSTAVDAQVARALGMGSGSVVAVTGGSSASREIRAGIDRIS
jgi:Lipase (class 3)